MFASAPFASEVRVRGAAMYHELRKRGTSLGNVQEHGRAQFRGAGPFNGAVRAPRTSSPSFKSKPMRPITFALIIAALSFSVARASEKDSAAMMSAKVMGRIGLLLKDGEEVRGARTAPLKGPAPRN